MSIPEVGSELVRIAETFAHVISELTEIYEAVKNLSAALTKEAPKATTPKAKKKTPELAEVRALLAEISRNGKTAEVKALLESHGCQKLSEVKSEFYEELMDQARALL